MIIGIKVKICIFLVILLTFTVAVLNVFVLAGIDTYHKKEYEHYLAQQVKTVNLYIKQMDIGNDLEERIQELGTSIRSINNMNMTIYSMNGNIIFNTSKNNNSSEDKRLLKEAFNNNIVYFEGEEYVNYMAPLYDEEQIGVVRFFFPLERYNSLYDTLFSLFVKVGLIVLFISFIIGFGHASKLSKNIITLKANTDLIKEGHFDQIKILNNKDELGELSKDIYDMSQKIKCHISDMKREEEHLNLAIARLKELDKQQITFINNITHEFKTPLTVIKTYIDLLNMYDNDISLLKDAKISIEKEIVKLDDMVDKTLKLSSIEKYDLELTFEPVQVEDIINDICNRMEAKSSKYGITITKDTCPEFIRGDIECLSHIFINLVDNAIKYNLPNGIIHISIKPQGDMLMINFSDNGIGIPKDKWELVFEPFYTISKNRLDKESTGLGLSLCKSLVKKQNGTIKISDAYGYKTTFTILFPMIK